MNKTVDKWLNEYDAIERLVQTISQTFNNRSKQVKSSTQYTKLTASIRALLSKLGSLINSLSRSLDEIFTSGTITQQEYARRCGLINQLKTSEKQFERQLKDDVNNQRDFLIDLSNNDDNGNVREDDLTRNISNDQLLSQHDRVLADQERGLDTLSHIVRNQKQIATTIGTEIDKQNNMIDSMGDKMDTINERLLKETKHVKVVGMKTSNFGLWLLIILLLIGIIVIVAIPKPK